MSTTKRVWKDPINLPDGHRLFPADTEYKIAGKYPMIAIADNSGERPEQTDDGVLWLNFERSLHMGANALPTVPVKNADSEDSWVASEPATILYLARMYDWRIVAGPETYRVTEW